MVFCLGFGGIAGISAVSTGLVASFVRQDGTVYAPVPLQDMLKWNNKTRAQIKDAQLTEDKGIENVKQLKELLIAAKVRFDLNEQ